MARLRISYCLSILLSVCLCVVCHLLITISIRDISKVSLSVFCYMNVRFLYWLKDSCSLIVIQANALPENLSTEDRSFPTRVIQSILVLCADDTRRNYFRQRRVKVRNMVTWMSCHVYTDMVYVTPSPCLCISFCPHGVNTWSLNSINRTVSPSRFLNNKLPWLSRILAPVGKLLNTHTGHGFLRWTLMVKSADVY